MGACFISFAENVLPILCVVTKYQIFVRFPELFSKNLLLFASKSAILYPTRAAVGYNDRDELGPTALVFILLIYIAIFFIYLLIIYPVLYGTEKALPQPAWGSAFSYPLSQRIRVASSPKGRAISRPGSPLLNAECFQTP